MSAPAFDKCNKIPSLKKYYIEKALTNSFYIKIAVSKTKIKIVNGFEFRGREYET